MPARARGSTVPRSELSIVSVLVTNHDLLSLLCKQEPAVEEAPEGVGLGVDQVEEVQLEVLYRLKPIERVLISRVLYSSRSDEYQNKVLHLLLAGSPAVYIFAVCISKVCVALARPGTDKLYCQITSFL